MAGNARYTALLDACVLYPLATTDALMHDLSLPDADDRHVLAAAIAGHADCIVTANLRDFPATALSPYGLEAIDPDTFIAQQWDLHPIHAAIAFKAMRARRNKPTSDAEEFVSALEKGGLPATAERLRTAIDLL
jgi:hypothetical protein